MGKLYPKLFLLFIPLLILLGVLFLFPSPASAITTTCRNPALTCSIPGGCWCPNGGYWFYTAGEGTPTTCDYTWTNVDCGNPPPDSTVGSDWTCYYPVCSEMTFSGGAKCTWSNSTCPATDICQSEVSYLKAGRCNSNYEARKIDPCTTGGTYKTCCNPDGNMSGSACVITDPDNSKGVCPSGSSSVICGVSQSTCDAVAPYRCSTAACGSPACADEFPQSTPPPSSTPTPIPTPPPSSPPPGCPPMTCSYSELNSVCPTGVQIVTGTGCSGFNCAGCEYVGGCSDIDCEPVGGCNWNGIEDNGETGTDCGGGGCPDCPGPQPQNIPSLDSRLWVSKTGPSAWNIPECGNPESAGWQTSISAAPGDRLWLLIKVKNTGEANRSFGIRDNFQTFDPDVWQALDTTKPYPRSGNFIGFYEDSDWDQGEGFGAGWIWCGTVDFYLNSNPPSFRNQAYNEDWATLDPNQVGVYSDTCGTDPDGYRYCVDVDDVTGCGPTYVWCNYTFYWYSNIVSVSTTLPQPCNNGTPPDNRMYACYFEPGTTYFNPFPQPPDSGGSALSQGLEPSGTLPGGSSLVGTATAVDENWGTGQVDGSGKSNNVTAIWKGRINFQAGTYNFYVGADDGYALTINGGPEGTINVFSNWNYAPNYTSPTSVPVAFSTAGWRTVIFKYFEGPDQAAALLRWNYTPTSTPGPLLPWIQVTGDVHSNIRINAPGGP